MRDIIEEIFKKIDKNLKEDIEFCEENGFRTGDNFCMAGHSWLLRQRILLKKLAKKYGVDLE
jgi:CBS domain containing-hemolysin-like protein